MAPLFHGWRRKAGCTTLVLACLLAMAWLRSLRVDDGYTLRQDGSTNYAMSSEDGRFVFCMARGGVHGPYLEINYKQYRSDPRKISGAERVAIAEALCHDEVGVRSRRLRARNIQIKWQRSWHGFELAKRSNESPLMDDVEATFLPVPYWSIVIPLTMLSARLLLSSPRNRTRTRSEQTLNVRE